MKIDRLAEEHIKDLEVLLDLKTEECEEWMQRAKILEAELIRLRQDRRYEVA